MIASPGDAPFGESGVNCAPMAWSKKRQLSSAKQTMQPVSALPTLRVSEIAYASLLAGNNNQHVAPHHAENIPDGQAFQAFFFESCRRCGSYAHRLVRARNSSTRAGSCPPVVHIPECR